MPKFKLLTIPIIINYLFIFLRFNQSILFFRLLSPIFFFFFSLKLFTRIHLIQKELQYPVPILQNFPILKILRASGPMLSCQIQRNKIFELENTLDKRIKLEGEKFDRKPSIDRRRVD